MERAKIEPVQYGFYHTPPPPTASGCEPVKLRDVTRNLTNEIREGHRRGGGGIRVGAKGEIVRERECKRQQR